MGPRYLNLSMDRVRVRTQIFDPDLILVIELRSKPEYLVDLVLKY